MIVQCVKLISVLGTPEERSGWLTVGRDYTVLELAVIPGRSEGMPIVEFRIESDGGGTPALFRGEQFGVVDGRLPSNWRALISADGRLDIGPEAWHRQGFWED
jgi:hypothetical protein